MLKTFLQIAKTFYPPVILFSFHLIVGGYFQMYLIWPDFDIPMHFGGGFAMGMTAFLLMRLATEKNWLQVQSKLVALFIGICFVSLTATVWEFAEFLSDHFLGTHMQAGLPDTMFDMFLGVLGGLIAGTLMLKKLFPKK